MTPVATDSPPLAAGADGVIRVGGTRVTIDTLVAAYELGATAETIADQYPSLSLADIYSALGYYLRHQPEIDAYLRQRQAQTDDTRRQNEVRFSPTGVRDRLFARRGRQG